MATESCRNESLTSPLRQAVGVVVGLAMMYVLKETWLDVMQNFSVSLNEAWDKDELSSTGASN